LLSSFEGAEFEGVEIELSKAKATTYSPKLPTDKKYPPRGRGDDKKKPKRRHKKKF